MTGQLPKPATIWVHDFIATPDDLPEHSTLTGQHAEPETPQTAEHIATGRTMGALIAKKMVNEINAMGMHAKHATKQSSPAVNDIIIQGHLISFEEGSEWKGIIIGFNQGNTDLKAAVEGFQITDKGLCRLGKGSTDATGSKTPGGALGGVIFLATHNPAGLIVNTGLKVYGEESSKDTIEGRAKQTAENICEILEQRFQEQGWIPASNK